MSKGQHRRHPLLADREWLRLSLERKSQAEIARDLWTSSSTVAYHVRRHGLHARGRAAEASASPPGHPQA